MLQLNDWAKNFIFRFGDYPPISNETAGTYTRIESAYGRLIEVFLYVNQDAFPLLPSEVIDDINSAISRIYESIYWARRSLGAPKDSGYASVDWLLISDRQDGMITEAYKLVSQRLIKHCPANLFLENSLIRLMNSYNIAADVTKVSLGVMSARQNRWLDPRKKRTGHSFILQANRGGDRSDLPLEGLDFAVTDHEKTRIINASRAF